MSFVVGIIIGTFFGSGIGFILAGLMASASKVDDEVND